MKTSLTEDHLEPIFDKLRGPAAGSAGSGEPDPAGVGRPQPVHTVYGGAHLFRFDVARKLGELALASLDAHAPEPATFASALGLPEGLADTVYRRVRDKLRCQPVEDLRIDFEDGYGARPDDEEDEAASMAARETARGMEEGTLPPFIGIRIKPLSTASRQRAARTLDLFLTELADHADGSLPDGFRVTLPKVSDSTQVRALADLLDVLENAAGLAPGTVRIELMIETPRALIDDDGRCPLPELVDAGRGRCAAAHFGPYDYTAACGISAEHQSPTHPACDHARQTMQVALAGTGVWLADGPTNVLPLPVHRPPEGGSLEERQERDNREAVHSAWKLHHDNVRHALIAGIYQGWDLHPAQLPARHAAVQAFFLEALDAAAARLRNLVDQAARATAAGGAFDDAATGQGLLNFFVRGLASGAITEEDLRPTGLAPEDLRGRSFTGIVARRDDGGGGEPSMGP